MNWEIRKPSLGLEPCVLDGIQESKVGERAAGTTSPFESSRNIRCYGRANCPP